MSLENHENQQNHYPSLTSTLRIDRAHATTQLETLGYSRGDALYVCAILPKEDPRYCPGRKADKLNWEQVEGWQAEGYGIYICTVVNGSGHKDEDVTSCRALFCEFDDRPIEDQINFWQDLGLSEPSLQIANRKLTTPTNTAEVIAMGEGSDA